MSIDMKDVITDRMILRVLEEEFRRLAVVNRHQSSGYIPRNAYDIRRDAFKTCIGCGSATQPCCGH